MSGEWEGRVTRLTFSIDVGVFSETILHGLELFYTVDTLGFLLRVDETGKGGLEVFPTGTLGHPAEALRQNESGRVESSRVGCEYLGVQMSKTVHNDQHDDKLGTRNSQDNPS